MLITCGGSRIAIYTRVQCNNSQIKGEGTSRVCGDKTSMHNNANRKVNLGLLGFGWYKTVSTVTG